MGMRPCCWPNCSVLVRRFHVQLAKLRVPRPVARIPRLGARVKRLTQAAIDQTTQVRVSWSGLSDQAVREEVLRRLRDLFPDSRVGVRRW